MEIEGSDGSKTLINPNSTTVFGRGNGFNLNDLSVSRRQISFDFNSSHDIQTDPRVSFEVLGKNPIWVYRKHQDNNENIKLFKRFQRGELGIHDFFCVSAKNPVWFTLKKVEETQSEEIKGRINDELSQSLESASGFNGNEDFELGFVDVSNIDPVQEFGFLVIGHEFDHYPKHMIREINKWDWFLEDLRRDTDDEEDSEKKQSMGGRRKRKKTNVADDDADEEWTAESEGEEQTTNARKAQRPKYQTRSKEHSVGQKVRSTSKLSAQTSRREEEEEESEDEEDETLGGFIVDEDSAEEDEIDKDEEEEEEEEEEFIEDEDELED
ncbi:hypothetical protein BVRB_7g170510 [Beta vulgaris subsp. vulgaris]|nr:hypothetical protein BVRB_7g170510 [Beta vulgaris subsp. vulgaris]